MHRCKNKFSLQELRRFTTFLFHPLLISRQPSVFPANLQPANLPTFILSPSSFILPLWR
jgi:hypothetical protein